MELLCALPFVYRYMNFQVLVQLENEIGDLETQTGRRPRAEQPRQESFSGYTMSLVDSVTKLSRYLKDVCMQWITCSFFWPELRNLILHTVGHLYSLDLKVCNYTSSLGYDFVNKCCSCLIINASFKSISIFMVT